MKLTKEMLNEMGACNDGMRWFLKKFNGEAEVKDVIKELINDEEESHLSWLNSKLLISKNINIEEFINDSVQAVIENTTSEESDTVSSGDYAKIGSSGDDAQIGSSGYRAKIGSSGNYAQISSSGDDAKIGSSGDDAQIGSSGDYAKIGSSGYRAKIGSSGNYAQIGSSGYRAKIGSSGNYAQISSSGDDAQIGSSGDDAQIGSSGKNTVIASAGRCCKAKAAEGGVIALTWWDEGSNRFRISVGYIGEDLEADTWYHVDKHGKFQKC